jgi:predicted permease
MANPNIVNVTSIYGNTSYLIPANTAANLWPALTPSANSVNKINNIVVSNVTASAVAVTVAVNSAAGGVGTSYDIAYQVSVPANASLIVVDKTTSIYVGESQSIMVTVGTGSALELTASYETLT